MIRKVAGWALVALVVFVVIKNPATSAHHVRTFWDGVVSFVTNLVA